MLKYFSIFLLALVSSASVADSRILATGGGTQIEGQAGGGIVPWAVLSGYGSSDEFGLSAFASHVNVDDYSLTAYGAAFSYDNRVEFSLARQSFDLGTLGKAIGMRGKSFRQDIVGLKVRLFGDLIYNALPQVAIGTQYKRHLDFRVPELVGAMRKDDFDFYLSATKLWLAGLFERNVFLNTNVRYTRANQMGLLGFGGDREDNRELVFELSTGLFLTRHIAVGFEYRQHPENLSFSEQDDWYDAFIGIFPNKNISIIGAYTDLGTVATLEDQDGFYVSIEIAY